jgi:hypothetical protein
LSAERLSMRMLRAVFTKCQASAKARMYMRSAWEHPFIAGKAAHRSSAGGQVRSAPGTLGGVGKAETRLGRPLQPIPAGTGARLAFREVTTLEVKEVLRRRARAPRRLAPVVCLARRRSGLGGRAQPLEGRLLRVADTALDLALGLGLRDEGEARVDAPEAHLVEEVVSDILGAVVHSELKPALPDVPNSGSEWVSMKSISPGDERDA